VSPADDPRQVCNTCIHRIQSRTCLGANGAAAPGLQQPGGPILIHLMHILFGLAQPFFFPFQLSPVYLLDMDSTRTSERDRSREAPAARRHSGPQAPRSAGPPLAGSPPGSTSTAPPLTTSPLIFTVTSDLTAGTGRRGYMAALDCVLPWYWSRAVERTEDPRSISSLSGMWFWLCFGGLF
jgi:hypothetical protein